tara:strand:+ start:234 stop:488 length:255 start_codon:yes stop_codon:yes gene_type:complete
MKIDNNNTFDNNGHGNDFIADVSTRLFKYIEVKTYDDGGVVKRLDVSGKTDKSVDTIEAGMNRNLNHDQYYTFSYDSEVELDTI